MAKFMTLEELENEFGQFNLDEHVPNTFVKHKSIDLPDHKAVLGLLQVAQFRYDNKKNIDSIHLYPFIQQVSNGAFCLQSSIYLSQLTDRQKWLLDPQWKVFIREYKGAEPGFDQLAIFIEKNKNFSIQKLKKFLYFVISDIKYFERQYELEQFHKFVSD